MKQPRQHRPPHLYISKADYFFTITTYHHQPFLNTTYKKDLLLSIVKQSLKAEGFILTGWVILDNHMHLLVMVNDSVRLPKFIARITGKSAIELNKLEGKQNCPLRAVGSHRKIWYQYWDRCIRDEKDFYIRLNYIHFNPVKHRYVAQPGLYSYSSYQEYLNKYGEEWLNGCFIKYPVKEFTPEKGME